MKIIEEKYSWLSAPQKRAKTTYLVLHHAASASASAQTVHSWHRARGWKGIGYHYYVRKDGAIYRGRPENTVGAHCEDYNSCSIGICFEGNFETEQMSKNQLSAGLELVSDILSRYKGIKVKRHSELGKTACPGRHFPFDELSAGKISIEGEKMDEKKTGASPWAESACKKAIEKKVFLGDGNGNYSWQEPLTREAFCVILEKLGLL
ncbi:peptidoglycan recognition protein family protein [Clostridiaceae bacterium OttesenSCG-928-D20]|nr:peptidoglycan recognition protein family protein [Clostridiaceae bacterium OttesenSCG-928-D20]